MASYERKVFFNFTPTKLYDVILVFDGGQLLHAIVCLVEILS